MAIDLTNEQIDALYKIENWWDSSNEQVLGITGGAGTGKALYSKLKIPTPHGDIQLKDLKIGDTVFNKYGKPVVIKGIYDQGELDAYKVTFEDGRETICNDEHFWTAYYRYSKYPQTYTLHEMITMGINNDDGTHNFKIPLTKAVEYPKKEFKTNPYTASYSLSKFTNTEKYLEGSIQQRWEYLQGVFDRYAIVSKQNGDVVIESPNRPFISLIQKMIFSLGFSANITTIHRSKSLYGNLEWRLYLKTTNSQKLNFFKNNEYKISILKKFKNIKKRRDYEHIAIIKVEKMNKKLDMRCIYVNDRNHLYLANDYIVTHNTTLINYFIDRINLKKEHVAFVAMQGKAAMQMARNGLPAQTIHSLIYDYEKVLDRDEDGKIQLNSNGYPKTKMEFHLKDKLFKPVELIVVDEASMVNKELGKDLLSFGIPIITLGDLNQLPPVFGNPFFLTNPDIHLTKIMRQAEGNPIVYLAQCVLQDTPLKYGKYGKSMVLRKNDLNEYALGHADIIGTATNKLRQEINSIYRENILGISKLEMPQLKERLICRKNNWSRSLNNIIYMTNGLCGTIEYIDTSSFNGKSILIDFKPDFLNKKFKNVKLDYKKLYQPLGTDNGFSFDSLGIDQFEFAYALTIHSMQGSQWNNVIFLDEKCFDKDTHKKLQYTAITRARESIQIYM